MTRETQTDRTPPDAARWLRVKAVLSRALDHPTAGRTAFLREVCGNDTTIYREAADLLVQSTGGLDACADSLALPGGLAESDPNVGRRVGAWTLGERLGAGGMGTVYLARRTDGAFEQAAAVKLLRRGTDTDEVLRRFRAERQILARLDHPGIVRLLDGGATDDGLPFFVLECVDGLPVTAHARGLPVERRLRLFLKICAPVQSAHERLIVHRDLKPGNILVTADGEVKLLDFGIAKLLEPGGGDTAHTLPGEGRLTPAYASPEQARGEPVTTASDVYALGALLYELLAGRSPHRFATTRPPLAEIARVVGEEPAVRPSLAAGDPAARRTLRGDLDNILLKALEKEPARRYPTVNALAEDVRRHLAGRPVRARRPTWRYRACKFLARNRWGVAAGALVVLALVGGLAGTLWQARRAARRFADASALAHSFLFEFHDSIRDLPGSTPARRLIVTRALEYLRRIEREAGGDAALRRDLVAAYVQVGNVQGQPNFANLGDTAGALASYRAAVALADNLPGDDHSTAVRAEAQDALGNLLATMGSARDEAIGLIRQSLQARREQAARHPDNPEANRALATSLVSLGDALHARDTAIANRLNETVQAEHFYLHALALREDLHAENPDSERDTRELARVCYRLGNTNMLLGQAGSGNREVLERGLGYHRRSVALREENLAAHPTSGQARRDLADGLMMKSELQTRLGDPAGALTDCRRAAEILRALVAADPENTWVRQDLGLAYYCATVAQRALGDLAGALESVDQTVAIYDPLAAADPTSLLAVARLNGVLRLRAEVCAAAGDRAGTRTSARRWAQCAERLYAATPGDEALRAELAKARAAAAADGE